MEEASDGPAWRDSLPYMREWKQLQSVREPEERSSDWATVRGKRLTAWLWNWGGGSGTRREDLPYMREWDLKQSARQILLSSRDTQECDSSWMSESEDASESESDDDLEPSPCLPSCYTDSELPLHARSGAERSVNSAVPRLDLDALRVVENLEMQDASDGLVVAGGRSGRQSRSQAAEGQPGQGLILSQDAEALLSHLSEGLITTEEFRSRANVLSPRSGAAVIEEAALDEVKLLAAQVMWMQSRAGRGQSPVRSCEGRESEGGLEEDARLEACVRGADISMSGASTTVLYTNSNLSVVSECNTMPCSAGVGHLASEQMEVSLDIPACSMRSESRGLFSEGMQIEIHRGEDRSESGRGIGSAGIISSQMLEEPQEGFDATRQGGLR